MAIVIRPMIKQSKRKYSANTTTATVITTFTSSTSTTAITTITTTIMDLTMKET